MASGKSKVNNIKGLSLEQITSLHGMLNDMAITASYIPETDKKDGYFRAVLKHQGLTSLEVAKIADIAFVSHTEYIILSIVKEGVGLNSRRGQAIWFVPFDSELLNIINK